MHSFFKLLVIGFLFASSTAALADRSSAAGESDVSRGKYLVQIGGCNDCHTAGFGASGGTTPEVDWLLGDGLGFRGGWGTTYPPNLRKTIGGMSEDEWTAKARFLRTRPPMPWWALNAMTESDARAMYKFVKSLGVVDRTVPAYAPPGVEPKTPYVQWPSPPPR